MDVKAMEMELQQAITEATSSINLLNLELLMDVGFTVPDTNGDRSLRTLTLGNKSMPIIDLISYVPLVVDQITVTQKGNPVGFSTEDGLKIQPTVDRFASKTGKNKKPTPSSETVKVFRSRAPPVGLTRLNNRLRNSMIVKK